MEVQVNQVLKYKNEPVGVRAHYKNDKTFYDIDIVDLKGVNPIHLQGYSSIMLVEHGDKLVTMLEKETGVLVPTLEGSTEFIQAVAAFILNDFATRTGGNVASQEGQEKAQKEYEKRAQAIQGVKDMITNPSGENQPKTEYEKRAQAIQGVKDMITNPSGENQPKQETPKQETPKQETPKQETPSPEAPKKQTKSVYIVKVEVPVYDPKEREFVTVQFKGEFRGVDKDSAEADAKEFYAHQENTEISRVKVVSSSKKAVKKPSSNASTTEGKPRAQKLKDYTVLLGVTTLGADGKTVETKEIKRDFQATSLVAVKPIARETIAKEHSAPLKDVKVLKAGLKK